MIIGLTKEVIIVQSDYVSVDVSYWRVKEISLDATEQSGYITVAPYKDKTYLVANGAKSYFREGVIRFNIYPGNWPFIPGTDAVQKAYTFIKAQVGFEDSIDDLV